MAHAEGGQHDPFGLGVPIEHAPICAAFGHKVRVGDLAPNPQSVAAAHEQIGGRGQDVRPEAIALIYAAYGLAEMKLPPLHLDDEVVELGALSRWTDVDDEGAIIAILLDAPEGEGGAVCGESDRAAVGVPAVADGAILQRDAREGGVEQRVRVQSAGRGAGLLRVDGGAERPLLRIRQVGEVAGGQPRHVERPRVGRLVERRGQAITAVEHHRDPLVACVVPADEDAVIHRRKRRRIGGEAIGRCRGGDGGLILQPVRVVQPIRERRRLDRGSHV